LQVNVAVQRKVFRTAILLTFLRFLDVVFMVNKLVNKWIVFRFLIFRPWLFAIIELTLATVSV